MNIVGDFISGAANGFREVWANKLRSLLSMSGIILGVAALVAMIGVVQGMVSNLRVSFENSGGILRLNVETQDPPEEQRHIEGRSPGRTLNDAIALREGLTHAQFVGAEVEGGWSRFEARGHRRWALVRGVLPDNLNFDTRGLAEGRFVSELDVLYGSPVVVIGSEVRDRLFGDIDSPLGEVVRIQGGSYTVVGVMEESLSEAGGGVRSRFVDRQNFMPATTVLRRFREDQNIRELTVMAKDLPSLPDLIEQIENILMQTHRGIEDFYVSTRDEQLADLRRLERSFMFSLGGIAAISLLIGGIGIMNVMLASVSERIREIGVRKAIGARSYDVFLQFLSEAVVISVVGGILGLLLSVGLLAGLREIIPDGDRISGAPLVAMFWGFIFSSGIGLLSGIYPAIRAARLDPIDALRYE